jgi:acetyl-CoA acetyltransferase
VTDVYIAGVGITKFGRREESLQALMAEAAQKAMADAELDRPDALYVGTMSPEEFIGEGNFASQIATYLGLAKVPAIRAETATSTGAAALFGAFTAVAAGVHRSVLVVAGEKMTHRTTPEVSKIISRVIDPEERRYGATMPALAAMVTRVFMARHGVGLREISQVAVKNHLNGSRNPDAHFQETVTLDQVMESRMVADPLRLYHCCPISDGAAAVVLTRERMPVRICGIGQGTDHLALRYRGGFTGFQATQAAAQVAYRMAGLTPDAVRVAELHDAFAPFELISMEDLGLVPPGKAARALMDGETALDGRLPINPSGGLKARGHPLGASGLAQVVEVAWQLQGRAGARQVDAQVGLAQSIGGLATNNWVTILEAA